MVPRSRAATGESALPLPALAPGLLWAGVFAILGLTATPGEFARLGAIHTYGLALIPWLVLIWQRRTPGVYGLRLRRALPEYGWGMLAGAVWRGLSMGFNLIWLGFVGTWGGASWLSALVLVPLLEEGFYRGYLAPSLSERIGAWPGLMVQALLFTLAPAHLAQGWPDLVGIFGFGLVAGGLVLWRRNLWVALGAHGFANVLPELLLRWV